MQQQTLGTDFEFALSKGGMILSALDENFRIETKAGKVFPDNLNCEIAINPVHTLDDWHSHIESLIKIVRTSGYDPVFDEPVVRYPDETLAHPESLISGCMPDMSAYLMEDNIPPAFEEMDGTRSLGGHVHATLAEGQSPMWWARWMDITVCLPLLFHEKPSNRREMYGGPGCLRVKPYGGEYRTLSSLWVDAPELREFVWNGTIKAIELAKQDPNIKVWPEVYLAIENHDLERAKLALDWLYIHHGVHQV